MDKTTSTSSSSAAAVADSASAAADSKSGVSAAVSATSVKLLIKASNQQFDDQIIESDLLWTVKRLKTQLSLVYPSKPPVGEQKLIYSGQLLQDTLQLKDVIRSYKDVYTHNHIFHLVYMQKNLPAPLKPKVSVAAAANMSSNMDGLRQRHVSDAPQQSQPQQEASSQQQQQQQQQFSAQYAASSMQFMPQWLAAQLADSAAQPCPQPNEANSTLAFSMPGQFSMQAMATQQAAMYNWMQHVYSQYMDQCVRLSNGSSGYPFVPPDNVAGASGVSSSSSSSNNTGLPPNLFMQQLPFIVPNVAVPPANPVIPPFPPSAVTAEVAAPAVVEQPSPQAQPAQQPEAQAQQQVAAAPRFPNIVQDEQDNRDWLDSFFSITRLAIFLTILYFNSSPLRCLVVVIIAGGIYLYHIGVLRWRHERNNNNINRNNNAAVADQIRQGVQQVQAAQQQQQQQEQQPDGAANPPNPATATANADPEAEAEPADNTTEPLLPSAATATSAEEQTAAGGTADESQDNNSNSVISFVRTFVVTFFTSLLPETPAL